MQILVINSGSSSIKFSFFDAGEGTPVSVFEGEVSGIGGAEAKFAFRDVEGVDHAEGAQQGKAKVASAKEAIEFVARAVTGPEVPMIEAIGYRVVHPGATLKGHQRITDAVLAELRKAAEFAPLHDPEVVTIIEQMRRKFPDVEHYACFDTVFHETMPAEAKTYPLPASYEEKGVRRYGFHGLSCESVVFQMGQAGMAIPNRMAIAHLGGGCSVTALVDGASVDTSMGLTPTGGVVMATRPGDLDPGLLLYLMRQGGGADAAETMLNHEAGLKGASGISGDMREVRAAAAKGDARAGLALKIFTRSVTKALGSYLALLGGLDAMVFTGGIGEHDAASRAEILAGLQPLGISLDTELNTEKKDGIRRVSDESSATAVYVVPAKEDLMIAQHVARLSQAKE